MSVAIAAAGANLLATARSRRVAVGTGHRDAHLRCLGYYTRLSASWRLAPFDLHQPLRPRQRCDLRYERSRHGNRVVDLSVRGVLSGVSDAVADPGEVTCQPPVAHGALGRCRACSSIPLPLVPCLVVRPRLGVSAVPHQAGEASIEQVHPGCLIREGSAHHIVPWFLTKHLADDLEGPK